MNMSFSERLNTSPRSTYDILLLTDVLISNDRDYRQGKGGSESRLMNSQEFYPVLEATGREKASK